MREGPDDWWRGGWGGEEDEESANGKEEPGFPEFLPPQPMPRNRPGNKQDLFTHGTLALEC